MLPNRQLSADELVGRYHTAGRSVILYAGTFEAYQGLELLVEAAPQVLAVRPATIFLCIGGKAAQIAALQKQAAANPQACNVKTLAATPGADVATSSQKTNGVLP